MDGRRWRVFIDTSALIAGIVSTTGAAREVLRLCEAGIVEALVSRQVLVEADRNLSEKLPSLVEEFRDFMRQMAPVLLNDPSPGEVRRASRVIHYKDAPILAAAIRADIDCLVTWNTRHFKKRDVTEAVRFKIVTPGEFLAEFKGDLPR